MSLSKFRNSTLLDKQEAQAEEVEDMRENEEEKDQKSKKFIIKKSQKDSKRK